MWGLMNNPSFVPEPLSLYLVGSILILSGLKKKSLDNRIFLKLLFITSTILLGNFFGGGGRKKSGEGGS